MSVKINFPMNLFDISDNNILPEAIFIINELYGVIFEGLKCLLFKINIHV